LKLKIIKNKKAVLFTGDGSFGMNLTELATAVTENLPIVIVLLNNNVLGMVRQWQGVFFEGRYSSTILDRKTDFVKIAEAFGAKGFRATNLNELENILNENFSSKSPIVIDCILDEDEKVLPMIPPGGSIKNIITE
jgi:acetolactate synthase-1/2/3 large subunit